MPPRYAIEDFHILDLTTQPVSRYYIRELLDSPSYEYRHSKLSNAQKLEIINALGLDVLTEVLAECFSYTGKTYDAKDEARFAWHLLNGTLKEMMNELRQELDNETTR